MKFYNKSKLLFLCASGFFIASFLVPRPVVAATFYHTFSDNFDGLSGGNISGQNGWSVGSNGVWSVASGTGSNNIVVRSSIGTTDDFSQNYMVNGSGSSTEEQLQFDFNVSSTAFSPQIWLLKTTATGDAGGYLIFDNSGTWTLTSHTANSGNNFNSLTTVNTSTINPNTWYTAVAQVVNNTSGNPVISLYIYPQGGSLPGTSTFTYADTSDLFTSGYFGIGTNNTGISYDNVTVGYNIPASTYTFTGSTSTVVGASSTYTIAPNGTYSGTITPTSSAGGTFSPTSLTFSSSSASQTFTFTPGVNGTTTLSVTSSPGLTNPSSLVVSVAATPATAYTFTGSSAVVVGASSTYTIAPNGTYSGTITPTSSAGGTFSPTSLTFSSSSASQTFTFTPGVNGTTTLSVTSSPGLTNPSSIPVTIFSHTFSDNFDGLSGGNISGQNGWSVGSNGVWSVASGTGSNNIVVRSSIGTTDDFSQNYMVNGSGSSTDQRLQMDFNVSSTSDVPQFWLRRSVATGDAGGYLIFDNSGTWTLTSHTANSGNNFNSLTTVNTSTINPNTWYTAVAQVVNNTSGNPVISLYIYPQGGSLPGTSTFTYADTSNNFQTGYFGMGDNNVSTSYDNVTVDYNGSTTAPSPVPGALSFISTGTSTISLTSASATGGNPPYSYQWMRATSSGGSYSNISGATALTLNDSGLASGTDYYYQMRVADASSTVATSSNIHVKTEPLSVKTALIVGVGDSITNGGSNGGGVSPLTPLQTYLSGDSNFISATTYNEGISGTETSDWQPGGSDYNTALAEIQSQGANMVTIMLGTNDAKTANNVSAAQYKTNMQNIINGFLGAGIQRVFVSYQPYIDYPQQSGIWNAQSDIDLQGYEAEIDSLDNGSTVREMGNDPNLYTTTESATGTYLIDGVHLTTSGVNLFGNEWGQDIDAILNPTYTLSYAAGPNGTLLGSSTQTVAGGASGTAVSAVPNSGYYFVNWSDASTANPRADTNVAGNVSVTANFAQNVATSTSPIVSVAGGGSLIPSLTTAPAPATTSAAFEGIINSLVAQVNALEMRILSLPSFSFTRNLQFGMTGNDVMKLQEFLIAQHVGPAAQKLALHGASTYFGNLTQNALGEFQKSAGITPAVGYFGPITRKYLNNLDQ